ncbi:MAG: cupin domain-containing protein [Gemmatimonadales bacterium]
MARERSKVLKASGFRWEAVELRAYKAADAAPFKDVTRQTLLGEGPGEAPLSFLTRYFEVQPGGYSTLERHRHPHAVVVLRGRGRVVLGDRTFDLAPHDCVYVAPGRPHQFQATGSEPLGFLCMVDRERDRPTAISRPAPAPPSPRPPASPRGARRTGHRRSTRRPRRSR